MKIQSIRLENFGPFYGKHEVRLTVNDSSPVIIFYGENMRGKTSFVNAIRWCLYGKVLDRRGRPINAFRFMNYDALDEKDFHMSVVIDFEHNGKNFQLERQVQSVVPPKSDSELKTTIYLRRDGHFVPTEEITNIIGDMLHEDIARFFLFDGEMLGHFELLLSEPGRETQLIKDSVEQILGLPALQMMVDDLNAVRKDAEARQLKAVRLAKKNEQLVAQVQKLNNDLESVTRDIENLEERLLGLEDEKNDLNDKLQRFSEVKSDVRAIEQEEQLIEEKRQEQQSLYEECKQILSSCWWMPIARKAKYIQRDLTAQAQKSTKNIGHKEILNHETEKLKKAIEKAICPVCDHDLSAKKKQS